MTLVSEITQKEKKPYMSICNMLYIDITENISWKLEKIINNQD